MKTRIYAAPAVKGVNMFFQLMDHGVLGRAGVHALSPVVAELCHGAGAVTTLCLSMTVMIVPEVSKKQAPVTHNHVQVK